MGKNMDFYSLRVNLTNQTIRKEKIDDNIVKKFVGGRGIGIKILFNEIKRGIEPLSSENKLIFATGPVTNSPIPTSSRFHVITKSPLTGGLGESNCGGGWGSELDYSGYKIIIIEGKAESPLYLFINNGELEFNDASGLWGKTTWVTEDVLKKETGQKGLKILSIGPAGENLVSYAAIVNDKHRVAGRCGVGAVMGSKNLKAIAVKGVKKGYSKEFMDLKKKIADKIELINKNPITGKSLPNNGTAGGLTIINELGMLPTRNFTEGSFEHIEKIDAESLKNSILIGRKACKGCTIGCGRKIRVTEFPYEVEGEGPEYETLVTLGSLCGIEDLNAIAKTHNTCDEMGLDGISFGGTIACAMELNKKGKIPKKSLDGLSLNFGSKGDVIECVSKTAYKKGIGEDLSLGSKKLAIKYGAPELAMQVKGLEIPGYDPRGVQGQGLAYAVSNRGACHLRAYMISPEVFGIPKLMDRFSTNGKAEYVIYLENLSAILDSMVICKFLTFALRDTQLLDMFNSVTGWNWSIEELLKTGERIHNLERLFINREGYSGDSDCLPKRFLEEPLTKGNSKNTVVDLDKMLKEYYEIRLWENGVPRKEKLAELDLI
jgi:aldehyde:ferredoxin oxidoreductase